MSLVTLAEAANFVESEDSKNAKNTRANSSKSEVTSAASDSDSEKGKRRPGGAGTREIHNRLEKNRRAHLKVCFETLKNEIPALEDKRTSNLNILKSALRYIQNLEKKTNDITKEREDLRKRNLSLRERLKVLRNDIKILLDANTKNGIKTELSERELSPALAPSNDATTIVSGSNTAPVSVATQTTPIVKKIKAEENTSEDEEINVDDVTDT